MDETYSRNEESKAEFQTMFITWLLFEQEPKLPSLEQMQRVLEKKFGPVQLVNPEGLVSFALNNIVAEFQDASVPVQAVFGFPMPFEQEEVSPMDRSQFWNMPDGNERLSRCTHKIMLTDMLGAGLDYKDRAKLAVNQLEAAMELFPDCALVLPHASHNLLDPDFIRRMEGNPIYEKDSVRFICCYVSPRFFRVGDTEEMVCDTLGLFALGLPDVQIHFQDFDPNLMVSHMLDIATYQFDGGCPIKDGETVDSVNPDGTLNRIEMWPCQYEESMVHPIREVLDIEPGIYTAGVRHHEEKQE